MDDYPGNLTRVFKANVRPSLAGVSRLIHAVAVTGRHAPNGCLAGSDVDNVVVGFGDRNGTDCSHTEIAVRDIVPGRTCIVRLPDTTARGAHVIGSIIAKNARYRGDTAASPRTDFAPLEALIKRGIDRLFRL